MASKGDKKEKRTREKMREELKGRSLKGSFDKRMRIDLPVPLPVPPTHPPTRFLCFQESTPPYHPPECDPKPLPQGQQ